MVTEYIGIEALAIFSTVRLIVKNASVNVLVQDNMSMAKF